MNYDSILDTTFRGQKKIRLRLLAERLRTGAIIPKGTFVIMASSGRKIHLSILKKDVPHKGLSTPLILNSKALELGLTPRYLFWFFSQDKIAQYLLEQATGVVFLRVPQSILWEMQIPLPKSKTKATVLPAELVLQRPKSPFDQHLGAFYEDYRLNLKNERFHTAVILAGAIAEMLVYQALLDYGTDPKLLKDDKNLGLGRMIVYLKLLKLEKEVPLSQLDELRDKRNKAIHAGVLVGSPSRFNKEDLRCFDQIIRHFGI